VLPQLAIDARRDLQVLRINNVIRSDNDRPQRSTRVKCLAVPNRSVRCRAHLPIARGHIIDDGVTENMVERGFDRDAYLPDSYLFDLKVGQRVYVRSYTQSIVGVVESLLPMTDAMPPEFQIPGDVRQRGQVFKISIPEGASLPLDQKVKISTCYLNMCDSGAGILQDVMRRIMNYVERIQGYAR
jgi:hypothetical protein